MSEIENQEITHYNKIQKYQYISSRKILKMSTVITLVQVSKYATQD